MYVTHTKAYEEHLLAAVQGGSAIAQHHFPRTLELLDPESSTDEHWLAWVQGCRRQENLGLGLQAFLCVCVNLLERELTFEKLWTGCLRR